MASALLLIDIQNDYFSGGAMELVGMETLPMGPLKMLFMTRWRLSRTR